MKNYTLHITRLAGLGDGAGEYGGETVFVPKSCIGDILEVREVESRGGQRRAEIINVTTPGKNRVDAICAHFAECGSCALQHLSKAAYQQFKRDMVTTALGYSEYEGQVPRFHFLPAASRRRVEFKVLRGKLAYLSAKSHIRVPVETCPILVPELEALIEPINDILPDFPRVLGVSLTKADSGIDMLLKIASSEDGLEEYLPIADALPIARLSVQRPDKIIHIISERSKVIMQMGATKVPVPAGSFLQATSEAQKIITDLVVQAVGKDTPVADLFCGLGTYSFPLAEHAEVKAYENDTLMINHIKKISPYVKAEKRDLFKRPLSAQELNAFKAVVINPPRMGAAAQVKQLAASNVKKIVMISCNHSTWSRDAKTLKQAGYKLVSLTAIDQFIYSAHIELVSVFTKM